MRSELFQSLLLDRRRSSTLQRQLSDELRRAVIEKRLRPGTRLPSSRLLASELGVARNTTISVFEQLTAEGYLESAHGSGTFVASALPVRRLEPHSANHISSESPTRPQLSKRGRMLAESSVSRLYGDKPAVPFRPGVPALDLFPFALWNRTRSRVTRTLPSSLYGYGFVAGYPPLRHAIADYLRASRGVRCDWQQVIIVAGTQQALNFSANLLLDPGDPAIIEDPGYLGTRAAFRAAGATILPVAVDQDGLIVEEHQPLPKARLAYVCPSHQYPLGATLPLRRRLALLDWARRHHAWIVEDDYDSEFRYKGPPLPALQGLDESACVLYMGTFSKVLHPALRLGYLVVPKDLAGAFQGAKALADRQPPLVEQATLASFMEDGHFGRHIRRMRAVYMDRQAVLVKAIQTHLQGILHVQQSDAGLHLVGWLPEGANDVAVSEALSSAGIECAPLSAYAAKADPKPGLLLGYAAYTAEKLRRAVREMAVHWNAGREPVRHS
ncbi:MAG TPA: PLP-dependent aminotransferase family protein [Bryobacteraceae bacterium]|nr:PLP-dependent aminotransferase family protein [Bryobacteraceae bacterium]